MFSGVMVPIMVMPLVWMNVKRIAPRPPQMKVSPVRGHDSCAHGRTYPLAIDR